MSSSITRRRFLRGSLAATASVVAYHPLEKVWAIRPGSGRIRIPEFDGQLVLAGPLLAEAGDDFGHIVGTAPQAVLVPGSRDDIRRLLRFAHAHDIAVGPMSMIGNTHSTFGQSQVDAGVAIDMAALCEIHEIDSDSVWVDAGVRWRDLLTETVPLGLSPPTLTDHIDLSVGGTISVGGIGGQAGHHGLIVDNVLELEVVTGRGDIARCSPTHRADLFNAMRAGLGQFGVIVRARVRLVAVPAMVRTYTALYSDIGIFTEDQITLLGDGRFDYLEGFAVADGNGGWLYQLEAATYFAPGAPPSDAAMLAGLRFNPGSETATDSSYFDFANRLAPLIDFLIQIGVWQLPHPWFDMFVPGPQAPGFIQGVLDQTTDADMGQGPILIYPFKRSLVTADFLPLPDTDICFLFSLLRTAIPPVDPLDLVAANRVIYDDLHAIGGTRYAISCVPFAAADWRAHFGPQWARFARAKGRYDPRRILTPGQGIFAR